MQRLLAIILALGALQIGGNVLAERAPDFVSLEERTEQRASRIVAPRIEFKDTTLAEALAFLKEVALERDPKHIGIRIESEFGPDPVLASKTNFPKEKLRKALDTEITISLTNISLLEALRYVTALSECRFEFTPAGVEFAPHGNIFMITHTIPLPEAIFGKSAKPERLRIPRSEIQMMRSHLQKYLNDKGVQFQDGASCAFDGSGTTMIITNSIDQLDVAHAVLTSLLHRKDVLTTRRYKVPREYLRIPGLENASVEDEGWERSASVSLSDEPWVAYVPTTSVIVARTTKKGHRDVAMKVRAAWKKYRERLRKKDEKTDPADLTVKEYVVPKSYLPSVSYKTDLPWLTSSGVPFTAGPSIILLPSAQVLVARETAERHRFIAALIRRLWKEYREHKAASGFPPIPGLESPPASQRSEEPKQTDK